MSTKLHFCPKCETLLTYALDDSSEVKTTILTCSNCTYKADLNEDGSILKTSIYKQTTATSISKASIYDPALRMACNIQCANLECPSLNPKLLGTRDETGKVIYPQVCICNNTNIARKNTYICKICKTIFTIDVKV